MQTLNLPFPPSVNHYWRRVGPRTLISRQGREFRQRVCSILAAQRITPVVGSLEVEVDLFPPDRRRRDIDNFQKGLLDALEHAGVYENDSQIEMLTIRRCQRVAGGRVVVRIKEQSRACS
ncbi:MAG: RusA family crossover junction endodeoxyribonuclease [Pirellulaceae bacterium]